MARAQQHQPAALNNGRLSETSAGSNSNPPRGRPRRLRPVQLLAAPRRSRELDCSAVHTEPSITSHQHGPARLPERGHRTRHPAPTQREQGRNWSRSLQEASYSHRAHAWERRPPFRCNAPLTAVLRGVVATGVWCPRPGASRLESSGQGSVVARHRGQAVQKRRGSTCGSARPLARYPCFLPLLSSGRWSVRWSLLPGLAAAVLRSFSFRQRRRRRGNREMVTRSSAVVCRSIVRSWNRIHRGATGVRGRVAFRDWKERGSVTRLFSARSAGHTNGRIGPTLLRIRVRCPMAIPFNHRNQ